MSDDRALPAELAARYEAPRPLGAGAFGRVLRARDSKLGRDVALKLLHAEVANEPTVLERFEREGRLMARVSSPHVVQVYETGVADGQAYIVSELIEGTSLRVLLRRRSGPLPLERASEVYLQILEGLAALHQHEVLHRDLKPDNVLVEEGGRVVLADLGLGRADDEADLTRTGVVMGTGAYMAPEQMEGGYADPTWDLYAASLLLYEMLTRERPFAGRTFMEILTLRELGSFPSLRERGVPAPEALDAFLRRALAPRPARRFPDAHALRRGFEEALEGATAAASAIPTPEPAAAPPGPVAPGAISRVGGRSQALDPLPSEPSPATSGRRAGLAIALLALVLLGVLWPGSREEPRPDDEGAKRPPPLEVRAEPAAFGEALRVLPSRPLAEGDVLELLRDTEVLVRAPSEDLPDLVRLPEGPPPTHLRVVTSTGQVGHHARLPEIHRGDPDAAIERVAAVLGSERIAQRTFLQNWDLVTDRVRDPFLRPVHARGVPQGFDALLFRPFPDGLAPVQPLLPRDLEHIDDLLEWVRVRDLDPARALEVHARALLPVLVIEDLFEDMRLDGATEVRRRVRERFQYGGTRMLGDVFTHTAAFALARAWLSRGGGGSALSLLDSWDHVPEGERPILELHDRAEDDQGAGGMFDMVARARSIPSVTFPLPAALRRALADGAPGVRLAFVSHDTETNRWYRVALLEGGGADARELGALPVPLDSFSAVLDDARRAAFEEQRNAAARAGERRRARRHSRSRRVTGAWVSRDLWPSSVTHLRISVHEGWGLSNDASQWLDGLGLAAGPRPGGEVTGRARSAEVRALLDARASPPPGDALSVGLTDAHRGHLEELLAAGALGQGWARLDLRPDGPARWRAAAPEPMDEGPFELLVLSRRLPLVGELAVSRGGETSAGFAGYRFPPGSVDLDPEARCDDGAPASLARLVGSGAGQELVLSLVPFQGAPGGAELLDAWIRGGHPGAPLTEREPPWLPAGLAEAHRGPWGTRYPSWPSCE